MVCNLFEVTPRWGCRVPHIAAARQCGANKLRPFQGRRQAAPPVQHATRNAPPMQRATRNCCKLQVAEEYSLRGCRPMQDAICNCAIASCKRGIHCVGAPRCKMQFAIAQLQVAAGYSLCGCRPMQDAICNCAIASCNVVYYHYVGLCGKFLRKYLHFTFWRINFASSGTDRPRSGAHFEAETRHRHTHIDTILTL